MLPENSSRYLLILLRRAHETRQFPAIWDTRKQKFILDATRRYKIGSVVILLLDVITFIAVVLMATFNHRAGLSLSFSLLLFSLIAPSLYNIAWDAFTILKARETVTLFNAILGLINSPEGKTQDKSESFDIAIYACRYTPFISNYNKSRI